MADPKDVELTKLVRREFNRRHLDTTLTDIRVSHGIVYIRGTLKGMRGGGDPKHEIEIISRSLRTRQEVRDVVVDCIIRT